MTPFNPDSWMDVVALGMLGSLTLAGIVIPAIIVSHRSSSDKLDAIEEQVSNDHEENLRDEISRGFKEVREDIRSLRDELHTERKERIDGDKLMRGDFQ